MKKLLAILTIFAITAVAGVSFGGTQYHVYKKKGTNKCSIEMRNHKQWDSARGSGWVCLGHFSTRSSAMDLFKKKGCKKA